MNYDEEKKDEAVLTLLWADRNPAVASFDRKDFRRLARDIGVDRLEPGIR